MTWLWIGVLAWVALAIPAALVIARGIRLAEDRRAAEAHAAQEPANFVATDTPPSVADPKAPWAGPSTVPFPPPKSIPRQRRPAVRNPVRSDERDPSARDSGLR
jgi:hypothetical protein